MTGAFAIEAGDQTVGIVVREGRRYRFLSSTRQAWSLDGRYYRTPLDAVRAADALLGRRRVANF